MTIGRPAATERVTNTDRFSERAGKFKVQPMTSEVQRLPSYVRNRNE